MSCTNPTWYVSYLIARGAHMTGEFERRSCDPFEVRYGCQVIQGTLCERMVCLGVEMTHELY